MIESSFLVSVIIPVFNTRPYLVEALDSIVHQTYENLEIILIDDGSSDGSGEICDRYAAVDKRILVVHQENKGLSSARNTGLNLMHGDVVAFLDSDDAYHVSFIENMLEVLVRKSADLVICGYMICDSVGSLGDHSKGRIRPLISEGVYDRVTTLRSLVNESINVSAWNKMYRRELWSDIRYPDGHIYEDTDTTFRIIDRCHTICVVNEQLYYYRIRPGCITDTCLLISIPDLNLAYDHFESFISKNIPVVFTEEQLRLKRQSRLNRMIFCYVRSKRDEKTISREDLRRQIIELGNEVGIESISLKNRMLFRMISCCPQFLKITYPVYHSSRELVRRVKRYLIENRRNCSFDNIKDEERQDCL